MFCPGYFVLISQYSSCYHAMASRKQKQENITTFIHPILKVLFCLFSYNHMLIIMEDVLLNVPLLPSVTFF